MAFHIYWGPVYDAESPRYRDLVMPAADEEFAHLKITEPRTEAVVVPRNPMHAYWHGHSPCVDAPSYAVMGPAAAFLEPERDIDSEEPWGLRS